MSIAKRLLDLARASVTDFRSAFERDEDREILDAPPREATEPEGMSEGVDPSESTVGARAGRSARRFKDAAEEAWDRAFEAARARAGVRGAPPSNPTADRKRWYGDLELEQGADLQQVRRAYRRLMKQYHPDRFANDPEKLAAATAVARRLTEAYNGLTQLLSGT